MAKLTKQDKEVLNKIAKKAMCDSWADAQEQLGQAGEIPSHIFIKDIVSAVVSSRQATEERCLKEIERLQKSWLSGKENCKKDLKEKNYELIPKEILQQQIDILQIKCNTLDDLKNRLQESEK